MLSPKLSEHEIFCFFLDMYNKSESKFKLNHVYGYYLYQIKLKTWTRLNNYVKITMAYRNFKKYVWGY